MKSLFSYLVTVGESSETFISFDCFLKLSGIDDTTTYSDIKDSNIFYFKPLCISLMPIFLMLFFIIMFGIIKLIKNNDREHFIR